MLRTFNPPSSFRGLAAELFPASADGAHLGRHTVIYGRNGSGKSTVSEYLRQLSMSEASTSPLRGTYFDAESTRICSGLVPSSIVDDIHVFNRFYVDDNLGQFLDGDRLGTPIVVLGQDNLNARKAVRFHESEITRQDARKEWASEQRVKAEQAAKDTVEAVKKAVIETLGGIDGATYNPTRFTVTKAERLLLAPAVPVLAATALQEFIVIAGESDKAPVGFGGQPKVDFDGILERAEELALREVTNVAIQSLRDDHRLGTWIEKGMELHEEGNTCRFCDDGVISAARLTAFRDLFNDSVQGLRADAEKLLGEVEGTQKLLRTETWLPSPPDLLATYEREYRETLQRWAVEAKIAVFWFQSVIDMLNSIVADPLARRTLPEDLKSLPSINEMDSLKQLVLKNNVACKDQSAKRASAMTSIQVQLAAVERENYDSARARGSQSKRLEIAAERVIEDHRTGIIFERGRMSNTSVMAANIDSDLSAVFGHDHLRVEMSDDAKGYKITRRGDIASHLSEGERHSIALLYFLRTLERAGLTSTDDLVVVDDPVTSLDREALFAAYSLLTLRLKDFGQTVLLTHDFELYRLSVSGKKSAFEASQVRIADKDAAEIAFPAVRFLEVIAERKVGSRDRESSLRALPSALLRHPSEYHYLFWCVADSLTNADESIIPLLGNAGRRLLEGFISFKAPNGGSFQHKMDLTTELAVAPGDHIPASLAEVKERVVRFAHGMSHRAEPVPTTGLDFLTVRDELRKILQFIKLCDPQHFRRMAEAVKIDVSKLGSELSQEGETVDAMPLHVFGWIPSDPRVAYVEVVRPSLTAYAVDLSTCPATAVAPIPGANHKGLWLFASRNAEGLTAHVVRSNSAAKYLRTNVVDQKWQLAFYVTGSGSEHWHGQHQHFLETSIRLSPERFGVATVLEPPLSGVPDVDSQTENLCEAVLGSLQFVLQSLETMLERNHGMKMLTNEKSADETEAA